MVKKTIKKIKQHMQKFLFAFFLYESVPSIVKICGKIAGALEIFFLCMFSVILDVLEYARAAEFLNIS